MMTNGLTMLAAANPVDHVVNHQTLIVDGWWVWSSNQTNLVLSALILLLVGPWAAKKIATGPESEGHSRFVTRNPFAHMIEVICSYLRDEVIEPLIGERTPRFLPFLWTLFFFILVNNLLGLVPLLDIVSLLFQHKVHAEHWSPIGGTATQNIAVTGTLAFISMIVINVAGIKELGIGGYLKHLTADAPIFVWPIIIPIEILGTIIKPVALAIRLFANMTAGHILMAVLFMFVQMGFAAGPAVGVPVGIVSFIASIAIFFLELFVAFLQAFVFMFLTTVFISLLSHHGEEHAHDVEPALA